MVAKAWISLISTYSPWNTFFPWHFFNRSLRQHRLRDHGLQQRYTLFCSQRLSPLVTWQLLPCFSAPSLPTASLSIPPRLWQPAPRAHAVHIWHGAASPSLSRLAQLLLLNGSWPGTAPNGSPDSSFPLTDPAFRFTTCLISLPQTPWLLKPPLMLFSLGWFPSPPAHP